MKVEVADIFFESLPNVFETKIDNLIGSPRTEYHCKNAEVIMAIFSMMVPNLQVKDTAIMDFVWFLYQKRFKTLIIIKSKM